MRFARGWLASLVLAPAVVLCTEGRAQAAAPFDIPLPYGVHHTIHGRYVRDLCDHRAKRHCLTEVLLPEEWTPATPIAPSSVSPSTGSTATGMGTTDILSAYKIPASTAANGGIVAILDSPDSAAFSDLTAYRSNYGLPSLPKCTSGHGTASAPCFSQVNETGGASSGGNSGSADGETSLDMDMISGACPKCSILLVELDQLGDSDILTGAQTATTLGAVATSISLGGSEGGGDPTGYTTPGPSRPRGVR